MPRTAAKINQADLARGLKAMKQAGYEPEVVYCVDGSVRVRPCQNPPAVIVSDVDKGQEFRL